MARIRHLIFASLACAALSAFAVLSAPFVDSVGAVSYLATMVRETFNFDVTAALLFAGLASLIVLAKPSPAAFREFWRRMSTRTDYSAPSTI